jgi:hypothetical protein
VALVRVPFYFINLLLTSLLYISILLKKQRVSGGSSTRANDEADNGAGEASAGASAEDGSEASAEDGSEASAEDGSEDDSEASAWPSETSIQGFLPEL